MLPDKNRFLQLNSGNPMYQAGLESAVQFTLQPRLCLWGGLLAAALITLPIHADDFTSNSHSAAELEYGAILFDYYQQDYFSALIEQEYAQTINNAKALSPSGRLFKGGMMLSYGLANESEKLFNKLLQTNSPEVVRNRVWFYLAKLHYSKSDVDSAEAAISRIEGDIPLDLLTDFHYLATLVKGQNDPSAVGIATVGTTAANSPYFPYFLFNAAIAYLGAGNLTAAVSNLERVTGYSNVSEELAVLADRARHGLAELAMQNGRLAAAWTYLSSIRTTGLYSNRALLTYAWAAINQRQYHQAIPALEILNGRSIALPEVQEAKVLLAHVYEQGGNNRRALQRNIMAEEEFAEGLRSISEARRIIAGQDVPREFVSNIEILMDNTNWQTSQPSLDYQKLTPFLVDLMASNAFTEALRELADLYVIQENLKYWSDQADQHRLILEAAANKTMTDDVARALASSKHIKEAFVERSEELKLYSLVLDEEERDRLTSLMETMESQLGLLDSKVKKLEGLDKPYQQPKHFNKMVSDNHARIREKLLQTEQQIAALEQIMRNLINVELDEHEDRMKHYSAQSRLAKTRLYDMALLSKGEPAADKPRPADGEHE
jgi:tetratricopeptide (TPR) repeat protein